MIWTKEMPPVNVNEAIFVTFLEQQLISKFGVPSLLIFDDASYFSSSRLTKFILEKGIFLGYSTNYHS